MAHFEVNVRTVIRALKNDAVFCLDVQGLEDILPDFVIECCAREVEGNLWEEITQPVCVLVLFTEVAPCTDAVCLVPDEADEPRRKPLVLPQLLEAATILHQQLRIDRDRAVMPFCYLLLQTQI